MQYAQDVSISSLMHPHSQVLLSKRSRMTDIETSVLKRLWTYMGDQSEAAGAQHPLRRLGRVEDVVGPAIFLASADADWITGTVLTVDGGFTAQ